MTRLPPLPRSSLPESLQQLHDCFTALTQAAYGPSGSITTWAEPSGALIGPYPFLFAANGAGAALPDLATSLARLPLPADARETALLVVTVHFDAAYPGYAHYAIAVKKGLLSEEQADAIVAGRKPEGLAEGCSVAYEIAKYLCEVKGALPQGLWDEGLRVLGKDGVVALLHFVGYYAYLSMAMNGCAVPAPEE